MPTIRISRSRGVVLSGFLAAALLTACLPEPSPINTGTGTGGSGTGAGGSAGSGTGSSGTDAGGNAGSGSAGGFAGGRGSGSGAGNAGRGGASGGGSAGRGGGSGAGSAGRGGNAGTSSGGSAGQTAFVVCVPCHGSDGTGVADKGPDIQHPVVDFSTWVIRNGRMHPDYLEAMPQFTTALLSDANLQIILTFLAAFPKPTTGAGLYRDYCANCHGADAMGGVTMRPIATEPMTAFTTNVRSGHHPGEFSNRRDFMPSWTAAQLSDADIRLIFMYVDSL